MLAAEDALEPAKKEFHGPAILVPEGDPGGIEFQPVAGQQQHLGAALAVALAGRDLDEVECLLEYAAADFAAEPNDAVAEDAGLAGVVGERTFFDDLEDGIVADTADEARFGIDDVLKELVLGVAAVDDVEPVRLQGGAEFFLFVAIAVGDRGITRDAPEDVKLQVELGGAMLLVDPQGPGHL